MSNIIKDIINDTSNRRKHFLGGIICGLCLSILFAVGVGTGMEFKDSQKGGKWDWADWAATVIGGAVGQVVQTIVILIIM